MPDAAPLTQRREFLLMPVPPTPNGRLHLGHMAGPYMRMDVLARYLRSVGHRASIVLLSDAFDSYVLWKAQQQGRSPKDVCNDFHEQIREDFEALDIDVTAFHSLAEGETAQAHIARTQSVVEQLVSEGKTTTLTEHVLYCPATDRYIVGVWLQGRCPVCKADAGGFFCEKCGALFRPETMIEPRSRLGDAPLEWREVETVFLRLDDVRRIVQYGRAAGAPPQFTRSVEQYIATQGPLFPLTVPGTWGVPWSPDRYGNPRVLFQGAWEFALTCGAIYAELAGHSVNPFWANSSIVTATSFGIDNGLLLLAGAPAVMSTLSAWKPFDFTLTNFFYHLQGDKFSTSRGHVIWTIDIIKKTPVTSDAVRFFLARHSPEKQPTNFDIHEFIRCINDVLIGKIQNTAFDALNALKRPDAHAVSPQSDQLLDRFLSQQDDAFALDRLSLAGVSQLIETWIEERPLSATEHHNEAYQWLMGLAYFAAPLMPRFAARLWHALGHNGNPSRSELRTKRIPHGWQGKVPFEPLSIEALGPCLPGSLALACPA